jgi:hypothetical protein
LLVQCVQNSKAIRGKVKIANGTMAMQENIDVVHVIIQALLGYRPPRI